MRLNAIRFLAILLAALALVPMGAHLLELPAKIGLERDAYLIVQGLYRGWALSGAVILGALLADLALAGLSRGRARALALAGAALVAASLAVFFAWTFPANQATADWTSLPPDWRDLRAQWEYSHAFNALLMLAALCCTIAAALAAGPREHRAA